MKGHIDLDLGENGFFIVTFANIEGRNRVFENRFFFSNMWVIYGILMRNVSHKKEKFLTVPIWGHLFSILK